jgi:hypothetical protein
MALVNIENNTFPIDTSGVSFSQQITVIVSPPIISMFNLILNFSKTGKLCTLNFYSSPSPLNVSGNSISMLMTDDLLIPFKPSSVIHFPILMTINGNKSWGDLQWDGGQTMNILTYISGTVLIQIPQTISYTTN